MSEGHRSEVVPCLWHFVEIDSKLVLLLLFPDFLEKGWLGLLALLLTLLLGDALEYRETGLTGQGNIEDCDIWIFSFLNSLLHDVLVLLE